MTRFLPSGDHFALSSHQRSMDRRGRRNLPPKDPGKSPHLFMMCSLEHSPNYCLPNHIHLPFDPNLPCTPLPSFVGGPALTFLPIPLYAMFTPRPVLEGKPKPHKRKMPPLSGLAEFTHAVRITLPSSFFPTTLS